MRRRSLPPNLNLNLLPPSIHQQRIGLRFILFRSAGVLTLKRLRAPPGARIILARHFAASDCRENSPAAICSSTRGNAARRNRKGKPGPCPPRVNTARFLVWRNFTSLPINSAVMNGMSQARNRTTSARVVFNAVQTPPKGPQRGTKSRRMTRTGHRAWAATVRTRDRSDWPRSRRRALSRPIRLLKPPARMQISPAKGGMGAAGVLAFTTSL